MTDKAATEYGLPEPTKARFSHPSQPSRLWGLIAIGVVVRLILAPYTSWERDTGVWLGVSAQGAHGLSLYARPGFSYPPGWGNILQAIGVILPHLGIPASSFARRSAVMSPLAGLNHFYLYVTSPWFNVAFKAVLGGFDLVAGLLVFALVFQLTNNARRARWGFALVFLNPCFVFESSVMGEFDIIVGTCILLAAFCVVNRLPLLAGAAVGLGTAVKVVPVVLIPVLMVAIALIARAEPTAAAGQGQAATATGFAGRLLWRPSSRGAIADLLLFVAGGVLVGAACAVPTFVSQTLDAMARSTSARETSAPASGGFSIYGLSQIKHLSNIKTWLDSNAVLAHGLSDMATAVVGLVGILRLIRRGPAATAILAIVCGQIAALLIVAPQTQPQYLIWILPVVVVLVCACNVGRVELLVMSVAPIVLICFVWGPIALLIPLATFTHLISLHSVTDDITRWVTSSSRGTLTSRLVAEPGAICVIVVLVAFVSLIGRALFFKPPTPVILAGAPQPPEPTAERRSRRLAGSLWPAAPRAGIAVVACIIAASLLVALANGRGLPNGSVALQASSVRATTVQVAVALRPGKQQRSLRLTSFPLTRSAEAIKHVFVFYDSHYAEASGVADVAAQVGPHLGQELYLRRSPAAVTTIGALKLEAVLLDTAAAPTTAIVNVTGALPVDVYSNTTNLVRPWLQHGGVMIWGGATPGAYSAAPFGPGSSGGGLARVRRNCLTRCIEAARPGTCPAVDRRCGGCIEVPVARTTLCPPLGSIPIVGGIADDETEAAADLQLSFRAIASTASVYVPLLGGTNIGWTNGPASSISTMPVGLGALVVFGAPVREDVDSTLDMTNILMSRIYDISGAPTSTTVLPDRWPGSGVLRWTLPRTPGQSSLSPPVELFAQDVDLFGTVTGSWVVTPASAGPA
jgi:hypothetical protein